MANTLKIKRGLAASIPQGQLAEPLFTTDTYDLYIGKGAGGNQRIQNYIASGTSSQFLKGDGSLDSTTYQATSEKGQNNGYASLDAGGKIPAAQLPSSVIEYKGTWNASTNTPTLADGTGDAGDVYIVSVGGTQNLGSGSITFDAGDWVMYNGSIWQKSTGSNAVASVNGQTGIVSIGVNDLDDATITSVSNGQLLQYNSTSGKWVNWTPTYISAAITSLNGLTGATQTFANDTNVIITSASTTHTIGWSGQLAIARGGTGLSSLGTSGQLLRVNSGATALEYFTPTYISAAITSLNGLTAATQTFATGSSGTDFNISSSTSTHTFNIPSASASNRGLVTTGTQTFAGDKTFSGSLNGLTAVFTGSVTTPAGFYIDLNTYLYEGILQLTDLVNKKNILKFTASTSGHYINSLFLTGGSQQPIYISAKSTAGQNVIFNTDGTTTFSHAISGTTAAFTSNSGNFNLGSQTDTAIYTHFGSKSASGGQAVAMRLAGTLTATANFDNLFGLWVDYTDNTAGYAGVTRYGIYQNDSAKRNYFGGPTTFNSAVTGSDTITATAFIPTGTSVPSRGMYTSASNVLDFSAGTTNLLSLNFNTGLSTFNTGVRGYYFRIVNVSTAEFGINTENNQGYIGTTTSHGFNIMTNNTPRLTISSTGAATFSSSVAATSLSLNGAIANSGDAATLTIKQSSTTYTNGIYLERGGERNGYYMYIGGSVDSLTFRRNYFGTQSDVMSLTRDGNVGIGTTDPKGVLHAYLGSITAGNAPASSGTTPVNAMLNLTNNRGVGMYFGGSYSGTYAQWIQVADTGNLGVYYPLSLNPNGGNVGIGTTSPTTYSLSGTHVENYGGSTYAFIHNNTATVKSFLATNESALLTALFTYSNHPLTFGTNNTERMRITSGGYSKHSNDGTYLNVNGAYHEFRQTAADTVLALTSTNASFAQDIIYGSATRAASSAYNFITCVANSVNQFRVRGDGVIFAQNTTVQSISDVRIKENIVNSSDGLSIVSALRPVRFDFKDGFGNNKKNQLGFIAQEVEEIFPDIVDIWGESGEENNPYKSVGQSGLIPVLVKAIQELKAELDTLKNINNN